MRGLFSGRWLFRLAVGLLLAAWPAQGSTGYPAELQSQLGLSYTPPCSLCHQGGDTDAGTVTTDFGTTMVAFGLMGGNDLASLDGALAGLEGEMSPFIGDLKDGVDPNNPTSGTVPSITYGCLDVTGQPSSAGAATLALLGLLLSLLLRPRGARR
jgi:hypothetical protein